MDSHQSTTTNTEDAIRTQAYLLSEQAGHPAGMEAIFWTQAERLVNGRRSPKRAKPGPVGKKTAAAPTKSRVSKAASPAGAKVGRKQPTAAKVDCPPPAAAPAEVRKPRARKIVATNVTAAAAPAKPDATKTLAPAGEPKPAKANARRGKKLAAPSEADSLFPPARP